MNKKVDKPEDIVENDPKIPLEEFWRDLKEDVKEKEEKVNYVFYR